MQIKKKENKNFVFFRISDFQGYPKQAVAEAIKNDLTSLRNSGQTVFEPVPLRLLLTRRSSQSH